MPLRPVKQLLEKARRGRYAVGYFECWNLESLQGVIDAAEKARAPVIIGFNGQFMSHHNRLASERLAWYAALGTAAAKSASIPCGLLFNECANDRWIRLAVDAGFSQVMLDDPDASPKQYVRRLRNLAAYAHKKGAAIEAEAGELPCGASGTVDKDLGAMTDPSNAADLVARTGVDILSVSIGNVHILVRGRKPLNLDCLAAIRSKVDVLLDLHGGSGIPDADLRKAIAIGVSKVCYGTVIKQRYLKAVRKALSTDETNPHKLLGCGGREDVMVAGRLAVRDAVLERMEVLGCCGNGEK